MNVATEKAAAREFVSFWTGKGYEKGQTQPFWIGLLRVLGVDNPDQGFIEFEDKANIDAAHGFIDGYIPATHVMIEQKSLGKNLRAAIRQSDGSLLSPYQQAKRYIVDLPLSRHPRWVVTCNFAEFLVYDMEKPNADLRRAHQENDRAVMAAYGFSTKMTEAECVAELFKRYQALIARKGDEKEP